MSLRPSLQARPTQASRLLCEARLQCKVTMTLLGASLGVSGRTIRRWELGLTRPSTEEWSMLAAFFAAREPALGLRLSEAAGVPSPIHPEPPVDLEQIRNALLHAADHLDVPPRRVRAIVRDVVQAVVASRGTLKDLAEAAKEVPMAREDQAPDSQ